jgi:hypothetical protein
MKKNTTSHCGASAQAIASFEPAATLQPAFHPATDDITAKPELPDNSSYA